MLEGGTNTKSPSVRYLVSTVYGFSKFHVLQIVKVGQDKKRLKRSKKKKAKFASHSLSGLNSLRHRWRAKRHNL